MKFKISLSVFVIYFTLLSLSIQFPFFHNLKKDFNFYNVKNYIELEGEHHHENYPSTECIDNHKTIIISVGECDVCLLLANYNFKYDCTLYRTKFLPYSPNLTFLVNEPFNIIFRFSLFSRAPPFIS